MEKKFIKWLLNKEEFKNIPEKKLVEIINTLAEKEPEKIEALVSEFKKDLKYAVGGKIAYLVSRMQEGGEMEDYNGEDDAWREDPFGGEDTEDTEGYASSRPKVVSREQYRINMFNSRHQHPDWTRRERKAWSLTHTGKPEPIKYSENFDDTFEEEVEANNTYTPKKASWSSPYWQQRASQFGFKTEDELKKWQSANGLVVDGKFGKNSEAKWRALRGSTTGSAVGTRTGTTNTSQSTYWDSRAKQFGFADSNAVKQWQSANGLVADGKFGSNSENKWRALRGQNSDEAALGREHAKAYIRGGVGQGVLLPITTEAAQQAYETERARLQQEEAARKAAEKLEMEEARRARMQRYGIMSYYN